MSNRITDNDLEARVAIINRLAGTPIKSRDNVHEVNPGNYHLDKAYDGVKLVQTCSEGGGVSTISPHGYGTKRELLHFLDGMLAGLKAKS